jgi:hypothetical protein
MLRRAAAVAACILVLSLFPVVRHSAVAAAPPRISVSTPQISPNGDGDRDRAVIAVTLPASARARVRILNRRGVVAKVIHGYWPRAAGVYRYGFDGTVTNARGRRSVLPEGRYVAEVTTKAFGGGTATRRTGLSINNTLRAVEVWSTPLNGDRYPRVFSPNGDRRKDGLVARFTLARPALVRMRISTNGRTVTAVTRRYTRAGAKRMGWNGTYRTRAGALAWAPRGRYTITVSAHATDPLLARRIGTARAGRSALADTAAPRVNAALSRSTIRPAAGQAVRLRYSLDSPGYTQVSVLDAVGREVGGLPWRVVSGSGSYTWNGRTRSGKVAPAGRYTVRFRVRDWAGNRGRVVIRPVTVARGRVAHRSLPTHGVARKIPWSGYWWPQLESFPTTLYTYPGPMSKYDAVTGRGAYAWEYANHRTTDWANDWWGHCQAWASAAIMEPQPRARTVNSVYFSQDDVEGLYSEAWWHHQMEFHGTRYRGEGAGSEAYRDVHPADFDRLVRYWIGTQRIALEMDFTTGIAVWNYPVYAFERHATRSGDDVYVTMTLTRAAPDYGVSGTRPIRQTFYYTLRTGTDGVWSNPSGSSLDTHPDYIARITGHARGPNANPHVTLGMLDRLFR